MGLKSKKIGYGHYQVAGYCVRFVGTGETGCDLWDVTREGSATVLDTVAHKRDAMRLIEDGHYEGWAG